jgi:hypothetical protein
LAAVAIAANANPASTSAASTVANGVSGSQSQGRGLAALPPSTATPIPNSVTLPWTKRTLGSTPDRGSCFAVVANAAPLSVTFTAA